MSFSERKIYGIPEAMSLGGIRNTFENSPEKSPIFIWKQGNKVYAFSRLEQISTEHLETANITSKLTDIKSLKTGDYIVALEPHEKNEFIEALESGAAHPHSDSNFSMEETETAHQRSPLSQPEHRAAYNFFAAIGRFFTQTIPSLFSRGERASRTNYTDDSFTNEKGVTLAINTDPATESSSINPQAYRHLFDSLSAAAPQVPNILVRAWRAIFGAPASARSTSFDDVRYIPRTKSESSLYSEDLEPKSASSLSGRIETVATQLNDKLSDSQASDINTAIAPDEERPGVFMRLFGVIRSKITGESSDASVSQTQRNRAGMVS